jgi:hypothetical protein
VSKTIVDQLVVTLGLDPKDFKKGEKEAAAALLDLKGKAKDVGDETEKTSTRGGAAFTRFASRAAIAAAVISKLKAGVDAILDASKITRDLANNARLLDTTAAKLRNFDNVAEMFGGSVGDARKTVEGLHRALFNLTFNGQMSEQLVMLGRLGVRFQDASGHMRDFKDIFLDTAQKISEARASGKMTEGEALEYLRASGFDDGLARAALGGRTAAAIALDAAGNVRQVTDEDTAAATRIEQAKARRRQAAEGTAIAGMEKTEQAREVYNDVLSAVAEDASDGFPALRSRISGITDSIAGAARRAQGSYARGLRNNNPGNLRALPGQPHDADGFAIFPTMEDGVARANNQLNIYARRDGLNTIGGIIGKWAPPKGFANGKSYSNNTEAYIADVVSQTGIAANKQLTEADRAAVLAAMFRHETNSLAPDAASVADTLSLRGAPIDVANAAASGRGGGAINTTNVDIAEINIHTQATDGAGIANDIGVDLRKQIAPHAEQNMQ